MKPEILSVAKQYVEDCKAQKHYSDTFYYLIFKDDNTVECRTQIPYMVSHIKTMVVINEFGTQGVGYYSGNPYVAYNWQSICLSDASDSEYLNIDGWKLYIAGSSFWWGEGTWFHLRLVKEDKQYLIECPSVKSMADNWFIVETFISAKNTEHLELLLKDYFDNKTVLRSGNNYRLKRVYQ